MCRLCCLKCTELQTCCGKQSKLEPEGRPDRRRCIAATNRSRWQRERTCGIIRARRASAAACAAAAGKSRTRAGSWGAPPRTRLPRTGPCSPPASSVEGRRRATRLYKCPIGGRMWQVVRGAGNNYRNYYISPLDRLITGYDYGREAVHSCRRNAIQFIT